VNLTTLTIELVNNYRAPNPSELEPLSLISQLILEFASQQNISITPISVPNTLSLLKGVYSIAPSPFEAFVQPISQIVVLILASIHELSTIPSALAAGSYGLCSNILHNYNLPSEVKSALESLSFSLGALLGAGSRTDYQHRLTDIFDNNRKQDVTDVPTSVRTTGITLLINHMVSYNPFGTSLLVKIIKSFAFVARRSVVGAIIPWPH
jgi:hypothetical protein